MRAGLPMLVGFGGCLTGGVPIGFALAFTALIYIWIEGALPGVIFAQQMARGIDNFVLLAIPFFILVGYLMEANGIDRKSTRLNSSHANISYAVFCLKKKKIIFISVFHNRNHL